MCQKNCAYDLYECDTFSINKQPAQRRALKSLVLHSHRLGWVFDTFSHLLTLTDADHDDAAPDPVISKSFKRGAGKTEANGDIRDIHIGFTYINPPLWTKGAMWSPEPLHNHRYPQKSVVQGS